MTLSLRKTSDDPPSYRVKWNGAEVGSISLRHHHVDHRDYWSWGVDTMPLMDHDGTPPSGEAASLDEAKELFRAAFDSWREGLPDGLLSENLAYKGPP